MLTHAKEIGVALGGHFRADLDRRFVQPAGADLNIGKFLQ